MAASVVYTAGTVEIDSSVIPIIDHDMEPGLQALVDGAGGTVYNEFAGVVTLKPVMRFTTHAIDTVLGVVGVTGMALEAGTGGATFKMYFTQRDQGALNKGASSHLKLTITNGIIVPETLAGEGLTPATITYVVFARWDGTNDPVIVAVNQSLPTLVADNTRFYGARCYVNGAEVTGVQGASVNLGLSVDEAQADGDEYSTFMSINDINPGAELSTLNLPFLNTIGMTGAAQGATDSEIYFRKGALEGVRTAWSTAEHIKVSMAEGLITPGALSATAKQKAAMMFSLVPRWDGTNAPFAVVTNGSIA